MSIILPGSNKLVLDEAERSLHDAICVVRCLVKTCFLICRGGAAEIEPSSRLGEYAQQLVGMSSYFVKAFAEAMGVIPITLAENAGLYSIGIITELLLVNTSALGLVTKCIRF